MPRNSSGTYTLPLPEVVANTIIESAWANTTLDDLAQSTTDSLDRYGRGAMAAALRLVDGSVTVPSWGFSTETNTGMYRPVAGEIGITVLGTQVGKFSANGFQGAIDGDIAGTPNFEGMVTFDADTDAIVLSGLNAGIVWSNDGGVTENVAIRHTDANSSVLFTVDGNTKMQFVADGVLLANHTSQLAGIAPWGSDHQSFDLGNVSAIDNDSLSGNLTVVFNAYHDNTNWRAKAGGVNSVYYVERGLGHFWYTAPIVAINAIATPVQHMFLDSANGFLSLGPNAAAASIGLHLRYTGSGARVRCESTSGTTPVIELAADGAAAGNGSVGSNSNHVFYITTNSTVRMTFAAAGGVSVPTGPGGTTQDFSVAGTGVRRTEQYSGVVTAQPTGLLIDTTGSGGRMVLITGNDNAGLAFSALYVVATRPNGGGGTAVTATLCGRAGSASPTFTFSSTGTQVTIAIGAGASFTYITHFGI
jgi:hypothetical protein